MGLITPSQAHSNIQHEPDISSHWATVFSLSTQTLTQLPSMKLKPQRIPKTAENALSFLRAERNSLGPWTLKFLPPQMWVLATYLVNPHSWFLRIFPAFPETIVLKKSLNIKKSLGEKESRKGKLRSWVSHALRGFMKLFNPFFWGLENDDGGGFGGRG